MLAEAAGALEPVALEHRHRAVVEERRRDRPAVAVLRVALDRAAPEPRDLLQGASERGGGDPSAFCPSALVRPTPSEWKAMHQHPPQTPL
jgi:hypothetical protein